MGVRGLTTFIAKNSRKYLQRYKLHDTYLVIDGNNIASHLYKWHCSNTTNDCFGGDYDRYAKVIFEFFKLLEDSNIIPLVIFDGGYEIKKFKTVFSRLRNKAKMARKLNSVTQSSISMFPLFLREVFVDVVLKLNIKSVRCDFEADYEMACLARSLNCPVLSYDSDFYVFDVLYIPFSSFEMHLYKSDDSSSGYCINCSLYKVENFMRAYGGMSKANLPLVATLLGNDYIRKSMFRNFYKHIKLPKRKQVKSPQQRKITSVIKWLQNETYDSAVKKILGRLKRKRRRFVAYQIKLITQGYICRRSKYLEYLNIDSLKDTPQSDPDFTVDAVEILNEVHTESESSDDDDNDDEEDEDTDSDTSETSSNCSDEGLNLEEPEEEEPEEEVQQSKNTRPKRYPDWFIDNFRKCKYPSGFMDILSKKIYFFTPQLEDYSNICSHFISVNILSALNKILLNGKRGALTYVARSENGRITKYTTPLCYIKLPMLNEIPHIDSEGAKKILLNVLNIEYDKIVFLSGLPSNWQLYILGVIYWIKNAKPAVSYSHVYSIVLSMLVLNIIDPQIGFHRSNTRFINKFEKKLNAVSISVSNNVEDKSIVTFTSLIKSVTYNDCLLSMKDLIKYFEMEEKMTTYLKLYDVCIVDCFAQFQSCFLHIKHLNALLNNPYETSMISDFYNGTFLYNICVNFMKRNDIDGYVSILLKNSGNFLKCFKVLTDMLVKILSDNIKVNVGKRRRKKKKNNTKTVVDDDSCNEVESEDDDIVDVNNRFTVLKLVK